MRRTEVEDPEVALEILSAAARALPEAKRDDRNLVVHYEHGQHWVSHVVSGAQWSALDTKEGWTFELVTKAEEGE